MVKIRKKNNEADIKNKQNKILCLILKEGKGSVWKWINDKEERFSIDDNTYFPRNEGTYVKKTLRFSIFLEGISTPIHHGYIEREQELRSYVNKDTGEKKSLWVDKIKGLKFDSKLIDMLLNRNLADQFTKNHVDLPNLLIILLLLATTVIGVINIGMWFA